MLPEADLESAAAWAKLGREIGAKASHGSAHATDPIEREMRWRASATADLAAIERVLGGELQQTWTVLDWGCGAGRLTELLSPKVAWVFAADVCSPVLGWVEDFEHGNVASVVTELPEMAAPAGSIDLVISLHVLYSVTSKGVLETINDLSRLIPVGGRLCLDIPYRFARDPYHEDPDPVGLPGGWWVHSALDLMSGDLSGDLVSGLWLEHAPEPIRSERPSWPELEPLSLWVWRKQK